MDATAIKYKRADWYDVKKHLPVYGIKALVGDHWCYVAENGSPLFFESSVDRDQKIVELRRGN